MASPIDWFPASASAPTAKGNELSCTTSMFTIEDLSYTPSEAQKSRDLAYIKATGRRSWKTLKGKAEAVWGPELEAVLLDALEQYQYTDDNKPYLSKHGLRFPHRNQFISQYIYEKTGKNRTHKQVGSRLQQLRDTCDDSKRLDTTPRPSKGVRTGNTSLRDESASQSRRQVVLYTQVTAQLTTPAYHIPQLEFIENELSNPVTVTLTPAAYPHRQPIVASRPQSVLAMFSNVVQLYSSWSVNQETKFVIYEGEQVFRQEKVNLRQVSRPSEVSNVWIYECDLAGPSWRDICASNGTSHRTFPHFSLTFILALLDPNRITILQSLTPTITGTSQGGAKGRKVSIVYHFDL
ncbi:TEA/ATTS domain family-domain-containing protein, partial [Ephemerocybe angulata]